MAKTTKIETTTTTPSRILVLLPFPKLPISLESETDSEESDVSGSDGDDTSWISWFCNLRGNGFFCEVDDDYIQDDFNLCGLSSQVPYHDYALDLILDVESSHGDMFTEEQNELIESAAEMLYGMIHARYALTSKGMAAMYKNYDFSRSKWFKSMGWEERMKNAREQGKLVRLGNLDPSLTSSEVQNIIWHGFEESCTAKMIQKTAYSSPHSGQAFVIFKKKEGAESVVRKLEEGCFLMSNGRPLLGSFELPCLLGKKPIFYGHHAIDKSRQRETVFMHIGALRNKVSKTRLRFRSFGASPLSHRQADFHKDQNKDDQNHHFSFHLFIIR